MDSLKFVCSWKPGGIPSAKLAIRVCACELDLNRFYCLTIVLLYRLEAYNSRVAPSMDRDFLKTTGIPQVWQPSLPAWLPG